MGRPTLTVIATAHTEGGLVWISLRSLAAAVTAARAAGITTSVHIILDQPDLITREYIDRALALGLADRVTEVSFRDVGLARNYGVAQATTELIALVDLDDLWSANWLTTAVATWEEAGPLSIIHPEILLDFGQQWRWQRHPDQLDPTFDVTQLAFYHCWSSTLVAARTVWDAVQNVAIERESGFGYEDWHWTAATVAAGFVHRPAPHTVRFYRQRIGSLCRQFDTRAALIPATDFYEQLTHGRRPTPHAWPRQAVRLYGTHLRRVWRQAIKDSLRPVWKRLPWRWRTWRHAYAQSPKGIPAWVWPYWLAAAVFEPALAAPANNSLTVPWHAGLDRPASTINTLISTLTEWPSATTHVFCLPFVMRSGAERCVAAHIQAIQDQGGSPLLVITERDTLTPGVFPDTVPVINLAAGRDSSTDADLISILARAIIQRRPEAVYLVNSPLAYEMTRRHGHALTTVSHFYALGFMDDQLPTGQRTSWLRQYLLEIAPWLRGIILDNATFALQLNRDFGLAPGFITVTYTPITLAATPSITAGPPWHLLWAGRLDAQKRPDRVLKLARLLPHITWHVWGKPYLEQQTDYGRALRAQPNIVVHGPYEQFADVLRAGPYHAFIYTAAWDGLPNILLEAGAYGLPIVTTVVGGVGELITTTTGWPVAEEAGPAAFGREIQACLTQTEEAQRRSLALQTLLKQRHTPEMFLQSLYGGGILRDPSKQKPNTIH